MGKEETVPSAGKVRPGSSGHSTFGGVGQMRSPPDCAELIARVALAENDHWSPVPSVRVFGEAQHLTTLRPPARSDASRNARSPGRALERAIRQLGRPRRHTSPIAAASSCSIDRRSPTHDTQVASHDDADEPSKRRRAMPIAASTGPCGLC